MGCAGVDLFWRPDSVANIMRDNNIHNRSELAEHLGISRATVYRSFTEGWHGKASVTVLAALAAAFTASLADLVAEPLRSAVS